MCVFYRNVHNCLTSSKSIKTGDTMRPTTVTGVESNVNSFPDKIIPDTSHTLDSSIPCSFTDSCWILHVSKFYRQVLICSSVLASEKSWLQLIACVSTTSSCTQAGWLVTPPPIGERSIVMSMSVCLTLCAFVCPWSYLRNCTPDLHQIFDRVT